MSALARLHGAIRDLVNPFALAIGEAVQQLGGPSLDDDLRRTVAEAEAEGAALIGARPCVLRHGIEIPESLVLGDPDSPFLPILGPCGGCGAEL